MKHVVFFKVNTCSSEKKFYDFLRPSPILCKIFITFWKGQKFIVSIKFTIVHIFSKETVASEVILKSKYFMCFHFKRKSGHSGLNFCKDVNCRFTWVLETHQMVNSNFFNSFLDFFFPSLSLKRLELQSLIFQDA